MTTSKPLADISPFTLLDFPDRLAAIFWFAGCNMRCSYCHNQHLIHAKGEIGEQQALDFLVSRQGKLDGVVLSGGEATLYRRLPEFAALIRELGFEIKLDTNGSRPEMIRQLIDQNLLDYVALDFKAPAVKYREVTGLDAYDSLLQTVKLLQQSQTAHEIRGTYHSALLNTDDLDTICDTVTELGYQGPYYLQNYVRVEGHTLPEHASLKQPCHDIMTIRN